MNLNDDQKQTIREQDSLKNLGRDSRLIEFDLIKALAIFFVLCGHSVFNLSSAERTQNILFNFISSFHMPLFMLISGFFSVRSLNLPFNTLIKKKFWQLIYPTITFGILFFIADIISSQKKPDHLISYFIDIFWFLKSCFLCYFILFFSLKLTKGNKILGCLIAVLFSQILPFMKLAWMTPFFVLGYLLSIKWIHLIYKYSLYIFIASTLTFIILFFRSPVQEPMQLMILKTELLNGNYSLIKSYLNFNFSRFIIGAAGSFMVISLIFIITQLFKLQKKKLYISIYGKYTLGIYLLHTFILQLIFSKFIDCSSLSITIFNYFIIPLVSIFLMHLCYLLIKFIESNKFIHKLLLKGFYK